MSKKRTRVPYKVKLKIVKAYLSGKCGYKEAERAAHSKSAFQQWLILYKDGGATALLPHKKIIVILLN